MLDTKILTFITVARTKNFTRTSEILNVTQPAVSQHIKALEEYYDVKLFYKKGKEMGLTEEGNLLYQYAIDMHRLDKKIKVQLKNKTSVIKKYNVGATLTIGGYVLPKIIGEHRKSYENTDIVLFVENTEIIMKQLNSGNIDIGVVEGPFDKTKVRYKKFKDDELVLVVSPNHCFAEKESVTVKEVLMSKLILRERGSGTRKVLEDKLLQEGHTIEDMNVYMEIGNITAIVSLVESGLGCTIISKEAVKMSVLNNKLRIVPIKDFKIIREFNFVYIDDMNMDFIDHFTKFCLKY
ncbi:LysR family transcriptional regulator [Brassicibacter mesophilus]|uniref:LysR family transcriptional regulator n=1 Tax=Brassicibacter mesophilus TaxID=745119 RepID=UPI003D2104DD